MISTTSAFVVTGLFALLMFVVSYLSKRKHETAGDFLVMDRSLGTWGGALSIAASWIWAPAVFICSQKAYQQGLPGIFWFTFPNILCFFTFVPLALRARKLLPFGYSMPDYLHARFKGDRSVHLTALCVFMGYQLGAIVINALAGGILLNTLTGLSTTLCILLMAATAFSYSVISGLRASVITDSLQMLLILVIAFVLVPWLLVKAGGLQILLSGLGGKTGEFTNMFDPAIAYSFGIPATLALISGPVADQMFFQRVFAAKKDKIAKIFMLGGVIFGVVPIILSLLGFIAAAPAVQSQLNITNEQMVGPILVAHYLPGWALISFVVLAFAGLSSTLDSSFSAISSLGTVDIYKRYINPNADDTTLLKVARNVMILFAIIGTAIALLQPTLLWCFLVYGALASAAIVPVAFSLFSKTVTKRAIFLSLFLAIVFGTPLSIYANVTEQTDYIVLASILPPVIGLVICSLSAWLNKTPFDYAIFAQKTDRENI